MSPFRLIPVTKEDHNQIELIFASHDNIIWNTNEVDDSDDGVSYGYGSVIVGLNDQECEDPFVDHSEEFSEIFEQLGCICTSFSFNNDYYERGQVNTHYLINFSKLEIIPTSHVECKDKI